MMSWPGRALLCVPTPLKRHREPDLSFVTVTADVIAPFPSSISSPITGNPCSAIARQSASQPLTKAAAGTEAEPTSYRILWASVAKKTAVVAFCGMG